MPLPPPTKDEIYGYFKNHSQRILKTKINDKMYVDIFTSVTNMLMGFEKYYSHYITDEDWQNLTEIKQNADKVSNEELVENKYDDEEIYEFRNALTILTKILKKHNKI